ncbi:hypothetical protein J8273_3010 [Carpediemonas membranifera]|uniref:Uncharacterized protein n=1 Tax=Carpediemonas membranifera TaxID=201153 RepID=A0A8J6AVT2_9EUKA|nr:hypothetical protein J8273_3010 [Carpediemonas membranifera]|eukprot:KAG9395443.1 hypothetical protein J8273_3010 [Carpediemonas membranifera]
MTSDHIQTLLLCALPASGKSETRKFLSSLAPEDLRTSFKIAQTVQLDDYPYVDVMKKVDAALESIIGTARARMFYPHPDELFFHKEDWETLIHLLNEDYDDLIDRPARPEVDSGRWMCERLDRAREKTGAYQTWGEGQASEGGRATRILSLPEGVLEQLYAVLRPTTDVLMREKYDCFPETLEDKTVVIEFARGGSQGSEMPLKPPMGYEYSFSCLSDRILSGAAVLYVWVTPEMSRAKNIARAQEKAGDAATSANLSLNHGVPEIVMLQDYGVDDIEYLLEKSGVANAVMVASKASGRPFVIPLSRFDNREDLTTFARSPQVEWAKDDVDRIRAAFEHCFGGLTEQYTALHG